MCPVHALPLHTTSTLTHIDMPLLTSTYVYDFHFTHVTPITTSTSTSTDAYITLSYRMHMMPAIQYMTFMNTSDMTTSTSYIQEDVHVDDMQRITAAPLMSTTTYTQHMCHVLQAPAEIYPVNVTSPNTTRISTHDLHTLYASIYNKHIHHIHQHDTHHINIIIYRCNNETPIDGIARGVYFSMLLALMTKRVLLIDCMVSTCWSFDVLLY